MLLGMMLLTQTFNLPISLACVLEILRRPPGQSYPCLIIVCTPYASGTDDVKHIDVQQIAAARSFILSQYLLSITPSHTLTRPKRDCESTFAAPSSSWSCH
ncbi:hypothetical protein E4U28_005240 [Claviceps purpurea]|nr:hypothetical protein E4U28_005240 [Claviceps purpurea]